MLHGAVVRSGETHAVTFFFGENDAPVREGEIFRLSRNEDGEITGIQSDLDRELREAATKRGIELPTPTKTIS